MANEDWRSEDSTDIGGVMRDHERAQTRASEWKPRNAGEYFIRLLPPVISQPGEKKPFYVEFGRHYQFDQLRNTPGLDPRSCMCLLLSLKQKCLACLVNEELFRTSTLADGRRDEVKYKRAGDTRAKIRHVVNMIPVTPRNTVIDDGSGASPVKTWEFGKGREGTGILDQIRGLFADYGSITNPQTGSVLKVVFESFQNSAAAKMIIHTPVKGPLPYPKWVDERHNLEEYVTKQCATQEQMREWFQPSPMQAQPRQTPTEPVANGDDVEGTPTTTAPAEPAAPEPGSPEFTAMLTKIANGELSAEAAAELLAKAGKSF